MGKLFINNSDMEVYRIWQKQYRQQEEIHSVSYTHLDVYKRQGVDFPGDMVSSLIIVKLPFAVPDPISEAQKKEYASLKDYIQAVIVPDMQKKLRQGFGRALRTETDTCVVSILDERAGEGGRYHEEVMCALPSCKMAKDIKDVQHFIRNRKGVEYYL